MAMVADSTAQIRACNFTTANFTANQASVGGGIYRQGGDMALAEVTLIGNQATHNVGQFTTKVAAL